MELDYEDILADIESVQNYNHMEIHNVREFIKDMTVKLERAEERQGHIEEKIKIFKERLLKERGLEVSI